MPAACAHHRPSGVDHRLDISLGIRVRQSLGHVEQRLAIEVEGARPTARLRGCKPHLLLEVREIAVHRERGRGEDPRAAGALHLLVEDPRHVERGHVEHGRLRVRLDPAHHVGAIRLAVGIFLARAGIGLAPLGDSRQALARPHPAVADLLGALFLRLQLFDEGGQLHGERVEGAVEPLAVADRRERGTPGCIAQGKAQVARSALHGRRRVAERRALARMLRLRQPRIARQLHQLRRRHGLPEEEPRQVRQVMRLVEDHRVGGGKEIRRALVAQRHVGKEEMVVHDDEVGLGGALACLHHEALLVIPARRAEAVLARGGGLRPGGRRLRHVGALALVAGHGARREALYLVDVGHVLARRERALLRGTLEVVQAHVVGAPLEERGVHREPERIAHARQVAMEQLVLQVLGAGRDDDAPAGEQRGREIGEGLAGAGARLGNQHPGGLDRVKHGLREFHLLGAVLEPLHRLRQNPVLREDGSQVDFGNLAIHELPLMPGNTEITEKALEVRRNLFQV